MKEGKCGGKGGEREKGKKVRVEGREGKGKKERR